MAEAESWEECGCGEKRLGSGFMLKVELTAFADGLEMHGERREEREARDGSEVFCLSSWKDGVVTSCEGADSGKSSCDGVLWWNCWFRRPVEISIRQVGL